MYLVKEERGFLSIEALDHNALHWSLSDKIEFSSKYASPPFSNLSAMIQPLAFSHASIVSEAPPSLSVLNFVLSSDIGILLLTLYIII